jgi:hypothetical protein
MARETTINELSLLVEALLNTRGHSERILLRKGSKLVPLHASILDRNPCHGRDHVLVLKEVK